MHTPIERVTCCISGCRRSRGAAAWEKYHGTPLDTGCEFICQTHWREIPQEMRRVYARIRRRERVFGCSLPAGRRIWRRLRSQAFATSLPCGDTE